MVCPSLTGRIALAFLSLVLTACNSDGDRADTKQPPPSEDKVQQDTQPDAFTFGAVSDAEPGSQQVSNAITITGINTSTDISVNGGEFSINDGPFQNSTGTVNSGDSVVLRLIASADYGATVTATLTVGGISAEFRVTTKAESTNNEDTVKVDVNLNMRHTVGGESVFDRRKFINIHASNTEQDWVGNNSQSAGAPNEDPDLMTNFLEGYDVYLGRDTGGMKWQLSLLPEDPSRPGFIDETAAKSNGGGARWNYTTGTSTGAQLARYHEHRATDMVVGGQQHPYWPNGDDTGMGWSFSTADSEEEPFGTAVGHYMANFLYEYFNRGAGDTYGQPKPVFLEVMNEPLYDLVDFPSDKDKGTTPEEVFKFHNAVADAVRAFRDPWDQAVHDNVLIGGYTVAFPDFEKNDFNRWEERDKLFIDIAGEKMDFLSLHFYDFPDIEGKRKLRRGSNLEATFDMLEQYTLMATGERMPFLISEFGATVHSMMNQPWSPERDGYKLRAFNGLMMNILERPDQILKSIPFITVKAEWGRQSETVPYTNRLMRQKKEADTESGDSWVYTELVKFYQLWAEVKGTRVDSWASDLDVQVNAYVDGATAYIVLNNLEEETSILDLATLGTGANPLQEVTVKELSYNDDGIPVLSETTLEQLPEKITLKPEATLVLQLNYKENITLDEENSETKYYADKYKQPIEAKSKLQFAISNVEVSDEGEAILRLGIGRDHGKSLTPSVTINGHKVSVPEDYQGYDQYYDGKGRDQFFGVIEIPVAIEYLTKDNAVEIKFPDDGGYVSTTTLQVFSTSSAINRGVR
ncbi:agarase [Microbulbifer thermotolerans]|uniref:agarase n=1 Tax=Microbulbifer thermotolerans TaxID=252514 RepID=UPI0022489799|nr:agarase [Microbulbifer thermotolerans]MCX2794829.1 agarase [Microbulbifer thermotolerans]